MTDPTRVFPSSIHAEGEADNRVLQTAGEVAEWGAAPGGGGGSATVIEDPDTGYPTRPATDGAVLWIGWSDPTLEMNQYDIFIPVPNPA